MKVDDLLSQVVRVVPAGDFGADVQLPVVSQHLLPKGRALAGELGKVMHPVENKAEKMHATLQSMMNAKGQESRSIYALRSSRRNSNF